MCYDAAMDELTAVVRWAGELLWALLLAFTVVPILLVGYLLYAAALLLSFADPRRAPLR